MFLGKYFDVSKNPIALFIRIKPFDIGEGRKRCQLSITATSQVHIGAQGIDLANATAVLKTPSGSSEPCLLKKMEDGSIGMYAEVEQKLLNNVLCI